jgi:hypothetical protein
MVILLEEKPSSPHPKTVRQVRSDINMFVLFFYLQGTHCSSGICSWSPNGEPALQPIGLTTFEGASQPKVYRIMGEPGLVD